MKKAVLIAVSVLCLVLVFACKSQPKPEPEPEVERTERELELKDVYDRYRSRIILDEAETYTVVAGDSLSRIAGSQYDDEVIYPLIMLASSDVVLDPDLIEPGMELTIPNLEKNLEDEDARAAIKEFFGEIADIEEPRGWADAAANLRAWAEAH